MKILIVVPAFNEEESIAAALADLKKHHFHEIVVVNDGSWDKTAEIARQNQVTVLDHLVNRGLGAALGTGFTYARDVSADVLVTFDADGQHRASDVKNLLEPIVNRKSDVVIGSRLIKSDGMPVDRRIINFVSNILTMMFYGVWTTDSQSGLRAFNKKAISSIIIKTDRMEVSSEFFKEIRRNNLKFVEVPIKPVYTEYSRQGGQSNLNGINVTLKMLVRLFR